MSLLDQARRAFAPPLLAAVTDIAERVRESGGRAWLVGGAVRDLLLGEAAVGDADLEVFGGGRSPRRPPLERLSL